MVGVNEARAAGDDAAGTLAAQILRETGVTGGLIVHLGCGDGHLTAALHAGPEFLVHGLAADPAEINAARRHIESLGLYGPVSVDSFDGRHLPYRSNLVNLLVTRGQGRVPVEEITRVLVPGGVAYVQTEDGWQKTVKPWPEDIDSWTHWMHDAGGSGVSRDRRVGPPRHLQWVAEPMWDRGHEVVSSVGAAVTASGRIFSVVDEGQTAIYSMPSQWKLVARDAFNGVLLWKRPLPHWTQPVTLGGFGSGFRPERMATDGQRVYVVTGEEAVPTALDAASGKTLHTLDDAPGTTTILNDEGLVVVVTRQPRTRRGESGGNSIRVVRADTFEQLWAVAESPQAIALSGGRVFSWQGDNLVARDARSGDEAWHAAIEIPQPAGRRRPVPTLKVVDGTIYAGCGSQLTALAAADGKKLWQRGDAPLSKGELFATADLLWRPDGSTMFGYDLTTGQLKSTIDASPVFTLGHHPRCYPSKATERYVITNNRGAEFVSLLSDQHVENDWVRGSCGYGILPANGLLYVPPDPCFCYPGAKILGYNTLAADVSEPDEPEPADRLLRGPAYGSVPGNSTPVADCDWPTYRHDGSRTGATACRLAAEIANRWTVDLKGRLTPPVVSGGRVYVAAKDRHTLFAMTVDDGRPLWQFTAGGPIDSPPTVLGDLVLFGSADGRVYCLRAEDGQLVWRFQAAPSSRRVVAFGQLESPWRVHGNVLVHDGVAYFTAGRSSFLDGGLRLFALEPVTGQVLHQAKLDTWSPRRDDARGKPFVPGYHIEGARSDILVSQGGSIYLGQVKFNERLEQQEAPYVLPDPERKSVAMDLSDEPFIVDNEDPDKDYEDHQRQWIERTQTDLVARLRQEHGSFNYGTRRMGLHVFATSGFLDDAWFNRTYWMYSDTWPGFYIAHRAAKSGQLLVVGPERTYAVQAFPSRNLQSPLFTPGKQGYLLLADANDSEPVLDDATIEVTKGWGFTRGRPPKWFDWVPIRIRGMVLAGNTLFVAGPPDVVDASDPMAAFEGRKGGLLRVYASADGRSQREYRMDSPPIFDGLIAAADRLFISTMDGKLVCMGQP